MFTDEDVIQPSTLDVLEYTSGYMTKAFRILDLEEISNELNRLTHDVEFDTIVGIGLSGALVVPFVARTLDVHWAIVRKACDDTHAVGPFEGTLGRQWIFVDDKISTGRTYQHVVRVIEEECKRYAQSLCHNFTTTLKGAYFYETEYFEFYGEHNEFYSSHNSQRLL